MVVVKAYDSFSGTLVPIDIPTDIFNSSCLKEMLEISDDPTETIVLPAEKVDYRILLKMLNKTEKFSDLVKEFETADFLGLDTEEILEKIGNSESFDPVLLSYCRSHVKKYLSEDNKKKYIRHFGVSTLTEKISLYCEGLCEISPKKNISKLETDRESFPEDMKDFTDFLYSHFETLWNPKRSLYCPDDTITDVYGIFRYLSRPGNTKKPRYLTVVGTQGFTEQLRIFIPEFPVFWVPGQGEIDFTKRITGSNVWKFVENNDRAIIVTNSDNPYFVGYRNDLGRRKYSWCDIFN